MCDHTCIMMTSFITNMTQSLNLTLPKSWNPSSTQQRLIAATGAWCGTNTDRLCEEVGWKSFTTESGIDACVTCGIIRDCITYILKYDKNVSF